METEEVDDSLAGWPGVSIAVSHDGGGGARGGHRIDQVFEVSLEDRIDHVDHDILAKKGSLELR